MDLNQPIPNTPSATENPQTMSTKPPKSSRTTLILVIVLLILVILGGMIVYIINQTTTSVSPPALPKTIVLPTTPPATPTGTVEEDLQNLDTSEDLETELQDVQTDLEQL